MKRRACINLPRFARDEDGATLVEFAVVLSIFIFMIFTLIDFARLGFSNVMAEKATEKAVRMAVVRAPACPDVARVNQRGLIGVVSLDLPNGTSCEARNGLCQDVGVVSCTGTTDNATAAFIWDRVRPLLPNTARPENLRFSYSFDQSLNRVAAAYVPVVTVELVSLRFDFISPLGALADFASNSKGSTLGEGFTFPAMSASLPAETIN
ncbi:TadE-like protein [Sulfitobacter sp. THAF37]|uniref:TadE/TadG family type IV pilus assembly protein n=1 Tax=Sulfitobacter sp. THAF37 TaxID=2587855 RepID=UPI0012A83B76|nr:TadE/TadG family type IV pilus assembly protein [Sulfitobacter sp. THAF37]QFT58100.1 TadE-like protein [Sulfitobacter sp. THAF37]